MEKESFRERPHWMIALDDERKILGWGNPMTDEVYSDFLKAHLDAAEWSAFKNDMDKLQFSTDKPIMLFHDDGKVIILKPGYVARQEARE